MNDESTIQPLPTDDWPADLNEETLLHLKWARYLEHALRMLDRDETTDEERAKFEAGVAKALGLHRAILFAGTYRVFPLWPVVDGKCTCDAAGACRNRGRHPMIKALRDAVRAGFGSHIDREALGQLIQWWAATPAAGVGVVIDEGCTAIRGANLYISENPNDAFSLVKGALSTFNSETEETEMVVSLGTGKLLPDDLGFGLQIRQPGDFVVVHDAEKTVEVGTFARYPARAPKALADLAHSAPKAPCEASMALAATPPPVKWLCRDLSIAPGRPTVISGFAGGGKSPFAAAFAVSVATGRPFLGMPVRQERVAWCAFEAAQVTHVNLQRLARGASVDPSALAIDAWPFRAKLNDRGTMAELRRRVRAEGYGLLVIDSYTSALKGVDHNSSSFGDALRELERLSDETGCTVLTLMHTGKKAEASGSREIAGHFSAVASAQAVISLSRPNADKLTEFRVSCSRSLFGPFEDFEVEFRDTHLDAVERLVPSWGLCLKRCDEGGLDDFILGMIKAMPGSNQGQVVDYAKANDYGRNETVEALRVLENTGALRVEKSRGASHKYWVADRGTRAT